MIARSAIAFLLVGSFLGGCGGTNARSDLSMDMTDCVFADGSKVYTTRQACEQESRRDLSIDRRSASSESRSGRLSQRNNHIVTEALGFSFEDTTPQNIPTGFRRSSKIEEHFTFSMVNKDEFFHVKEMTFLPYSDKLYKLQALRLYPTGKGTFSCKGDYETLKNSLEKKYPNLILRNENMPSPYKNGFGFGMSEQVITNPYAYRDKPAGRGIILRCMPTDRGFDVLSITYTDNDLEGLFKVEKDRWLHEHDAAILRSKGIVPDKL